MSSLVQAKCQLYHALLDVPPDKVSDADLDLMVALAKDPDIQVVLQKGMRT